MERMDRIEQRMAQLEAQVRRYRLGGVAVVLVAIAGLLMGAADSKDAVFDSVTTKMLSIENTAGEGSIVAGVDSAGNGTFGISNAAGKVLIFAGVDDSGAGQLVVSSAAGKKLIYAGATETGNGLLTVSSAAGKRLIYAGVGELGDGFLMVHNAAGKRLIYAGGASTGDGAYLSLTNKTGEEIVQLYIDEYGNGVVGAYNRKGEGRTLKPGP